MLPKANVPLAVGRTRSLRARPKYSRRRAQQHAVGQINAATIETQISQESHQVESVDVNPTVAGRIGGGSGAGGSGRGDDGEAGVDGGGEGGGGEGGGGDGASNNVA